MVDLLKYRLPGKEIVTKWGQFGVLDDKPPKKETFVVSKHDKSVIYGFEEDDSQPPVPMHLLKLPPYVCSKKEYLMGGESMLNSFRLFGVQKAVYSRIKTVSFEDTKSIELFESLCEQYPSAFVYLISCTYFGTWIGASPEVLLSMHGKQGYTMALAGTRNGVSSENNWGDKDKTEQKFVTDYIEEKLKGFELTNIEMHGPYEIEAGPVKHLRTDFSFFAEDKTALDIAQLLHPTPAVVGVPEKETMDLLATVEPHDRMLYTGFLGLLGPEHTNLYVNLRCCQIQEGKAFLYLGGGYTQASIPEMEWEETENKAMTLIKAIDKIKG